MKKKNKIKILAISTLLTGVLGVSAIAPKYINQAKAENENVVNINRENKKLVSYDDENYTITFTPNELNNYTWVNLASVFAENIENQVTSLSYVVYNGNTYTYDEYQIEVDDTYVSYQNGNDYIYFSSSDYWTNNINDEQIQFEYNLTWYYSELYEDFVDAIELDIQANTPESMGEQIIDTITSGLGLIGDLAQEFLTGFSKILWDAEHTKLTDFALFSLIMLGVTVSFAVIKLVLNIVRSNTGA